MTKKLTDEQKAANKAAKLAKAASAVVQDQIVQAVVAKKAAKKKATDPAAEVPTPGIVAGLDLASKPKKKKKAKAPAQPAMTATPVENITPTPESVMEAQSVLVNPLAGPSVFINSRMGTPYRVIAQHKTDPDRKLAIKQTGSNFAIHMYPSDLGFIGLNGTSTDGGYFTGSASITRLEACLASLSELECWWCVSADVVSALAASTSTPDQHQVWNGPSVPVVPLVEQQAAY